MVHGCDIEVVFFRESESGNAEIVQQGKMRWLHQNELQEVLKEELTLKDVSILRCSLFKVTS
jgi:hypothetical protein